MKRAHRSGRSECSPQAQEPRLILSFGADKKVSRDRRRRRGGHRKPAERMTYGAVTESTPTFPARDVELTMRLCKLKTNAGEYSSTAMDTRCAKKLQAKNTIHEERRRVSLSDHRVQILVTAVEIPATVSGRLGCRSTVGRCCRISGARNADSTELCGGLCRACSAVAVRGARERDAA